jgi:hypothetical protein
MIYRQTSIVRYLFSGKKYFSLKYVVATFIHYAGVEEADILPKFETQKDLLM